MSVEYMDQIRTAKRAEACMSYLEDVMSRFEKSLFNTFADASVSNDEDVKQLLVLKHHFDALVQLRQLVASDINQGKVAQKMISQINRG